MEFWRAIYPKLRDTLLGVYHYTNNVRTNVRQGLRQAYSPPPGCDAFFPNASHWAELSRPFRALSAISSQQSAISRANKSTTKQINISTIQQLTASAGFIRAEGLN